MSALAENTVSLDPRCAALCQLLLQTSSQIGFKQSKATLCLFVYKNVLGVMILSHALMTAPSETLFLQLSHSFFKNPPKEKSSLQRSRTSQNI